MSRARAPVPCWPAILGRLLLTALPLVALLGLLSREARAAPAVLPLAEPPRTYEAQPQDDVAEDVERYRFRVRPGASLWDIANEALPRTVLEEGPGRGVEIIEAAFKQAYPDRRTDDVRLGDNFVLEVPRGTFVTESLASAERGRVVDYTAFNGDALTEYRADPALVYRLTSAAEPWHVTVLLSAGSPVPARDLARRAYEVDAPDFLQVRRVRGALGETPPIVDVDRRQPYLDSFRNYRDRAASVEPTEEGLQLYRFDPSEEDIPFVAVEDAIGEEWDPANFPRVARREFYRDGTIKRYLLTQPGDVLSSLTRPDNKRWSALVPSWSAWTDGQAERLAPFAPALNDVGSLIPGRLLVLVHQPKPNDAGRGLECLGVPVGLAATAGLATNWWRRRRPSRRSPD